MHKRKSAPLHNFKALIGEEPGTFEAVVSVFGNVDLGGDRVLFGAFSKSLERWRESGDPIPVVWSHQWDDLDAHVGVVLEAKELPPGDPALAGTPIAANGGLWIKARLDTDEDFAARLWKRLERRSIREFSFAYDVIDERRAGDGANDLVELDVIEVGPTLKGMNPATELLLAKSLAAAVLAAKSDDPAELERILAAGIAAAGKSTSVPHTFTPKTDDPDHCLVCERTRNTVAHLNFLSAPAAGTKAVVSLTGSLEERLADVLAAGFEQLGPAGILDAADGGFYELATEGTFPDRVIFRVEGWNDPLGGGRFYECSIEDVDGELVLGEAAEVDLEAVVVPKARTSRKAADATDEQRARKGSPEAPEGRGTVTADGNVTGKSEAKSQGVTAEELEERSDEDRVVAGSTGEAARALLDLDVLELDDAAGSLT